MVAAVIGQKPVPLGGDMTGAFCKKTPDWVAARISYDAPGGHHEEKRTHFFVARCEIPPDFAKVRA